MNTAAVAIAVVGHTNTGKTSLLRTLTRDAHFGEVADRPSTTRDVRAVHLLAEGQKQVTLFDTPGLEDALGLALLMTQHHAGARDPQAAIEAFLQGDHGGGQFEQEAKVLRQMLVSDAALYVIDAREPMLAKHREELRLLAACGKPLLPLLNFVAPVNGVASAYLQDWKQQCARLGLHIMVAFDTVVYDSAAEQQLFSKLSLLLESQRPHFTALMRSRLQERRELTDAACACIADLLIDAAALQRRSLVEAADNAANKAVVDQLRDAVRAAEQRCVTDLLALFRFELGTHHPPELPLQHGRWAQDMFDPEALKLLGIDAGSMAVKGALAGLTIDAALGGASLGTGALIGAGLGTLWSAAQRWSKPLIDQWRGYQTYSLQDTTLALIANRQIQLLAALLRRGHASLQVLRTQDQQGWPSDAVKTATARFASVAQWSRLNGDADYQSPPASLRQALIDALRDALPVHAATPEP